MNSKRIGLALAVAVVLSAIGVTVAIALSPGGVSTSTGSGNYASMMGGSNAPAWMIGGSLPNSMMSGSHDPGKVMGAALANASGPRMSTTEATSLGTRVPVGAVINRAEHRITFPKSDVALTAVASPAGGPDETFRIAGMVNPTVVVALGARVSIQVVNADRDTAHGLVVTSQGAGSAWMPMIGATPAFAGSTVWVLGTPTAAGMHSQTLTFTATTRGTYQYLCPVPGHAQKGMVGTLLVT